MSQQRNTAKKAKPTFWGVQYPVFAADPDTSNWGEQQAGVAWFNSTSNKIKFWSGTAVRTVTDT